MCVGSLSQEAYEFVVRLRKSSVVEGEIRRGDPGKLKGRCDERIVRNV